MLCLASDEGQCTVAIVECWGSAEQGLVVEQAVLLELVVEQVAKPCEPSAVVAAHR